MCLAVPGIIKSIDENSSPQMAKVDFGGISKQVCLDFLPDAAVGNYVLVHVGFALSIIDEKEAQETMRMLSEIENEYLKAGKGKNNEVS